MTASIADCADWKAPIRDSSLVDMRSSRMLVPSDPRDTRVSATRMMSAVNRATPRCDSGMCRCVTSFSYDFHTAEIGQVSERHRGREHTPVIMVVGGGRDGPGDVAHGEGAVVGRVRGVRLAAPP